MKRANSGLIWIRQEHVSDFLQQLATHPEITHDGIDALPRTRDRYFRWHHLRRMNQMETVPHGTFLRS